MSDQYTVGVEVTLPREVNLEANGENHAIRRAEEYFEQKYPGAEVNVVGINDPEDGN